MIDVLRTSQSAVVAAGALIDFLWQGAILGIAGAAVLAMLSRQSPNVRYLVACGTLFVMCIAPMATFWFGLTDGSPVIPRIASPAERGRAESLPLPQTSAAPTAASVAWRAIERWLGEHSAELLTIWLAGVLLLSARLARDWIAIRRMTNTAQPVATPWLLATTGMVARRLRIARSVTLLSSTRIVVPAVIGCLKPVVIVPPGLLAGFPAPALEAILAHELAHIRRHDFVVNAAQCVAEVLLFYHPAVWLISKRIRIEREQCADDLAIAASGDRLTYINALVSLESARAESLALAVGAHGHLLARIRRLIEPDLTHAPTFPGGLVMTSSILLLAVLLSGPSISSAISVDELGVVEPTAGMRAAPVALPAASAVRPAARPSTSQATPSALPQSAGATLAGTVIDRQGGVIPGATVTIQTPSEINRGLAPARQVITNTRGVFAVGGLPDGDYVVTVALPGFRTQRTRVQIKDGVNATLVIQLEIGSLSEAVTVSSPAAMASAVRTPAKSSPAEFFDLAKLYYSQGRLVDAEEATKRALTLMRSEAPMATTGPLPDTSLPIRVGGSIREPRKIRDVKPIYPPDAAAAGAEGVVIIEARIGQDGAVQEARIIRGVPGLDDAAIGAVRQWRYTPTLLNGAPVDVLVTVTVTFRLQ